MRFLEHYCVVYVTIINDININDSNIKMRYMCMYICVYISTHLRAIYTYFIMYIYPM